MSLIQLTEVSLGISRPLMVNPDHVQSMRPRKTIIPIDAQQDPRGQIAYNGTILKLATGDQHFVTEDFDTVTKLLDPQAKADLTSGLVPKDQLPSLLTPADPAKAETSEKSVDARLSVDIPDEPTEAEAITEEPTPTPVDESAGVEKSQSAKKAAKKAAPKKAPTGGTDDPTPADTGDGETA